MHAVAFARSRDLDFRYHLLRVRRSPRSRDDTGTVLGELCHLSHHLRRVLYPHSSLASYCPVQLGRRHAPSRHTRNGRRSGRALEPGNVHAENSGSIGRSLRSFSLRHLCRRSRRRRIRHASRRLGENKGSSIGSRRIRLLRTQGRNGNDSTYRYAYSRRVGNNNGALALLERVASMLTRRRLLATAACTLAMAVVLVDFCSWPIRLRFYRWKPRITLSKMRSAKLLARGACPCSQRKNSGPFRASISSSGSVPRVNSPDAMASRIKRHCI